MADLENNIFLAAFEAIEAAAEKNHRVNEGDYYEDGLLYCGTCRTAKQCRVEVFGKIHTPYCMCQCETEKYEAEKKAEKARALKRTAFPEAELQEWNFENDDSSDTKISQACRRYVEQFGEMLKRGKGLLFYGTVGTGKTYYSACIVNALCDDGYSCLMTSFPRVVNRLQESFDGKQNYLDSLNRYHLLVLDDLAAERDTEYMNEIVQTIIDSRYRAGLPTIVTTNLSGAEIKNPTDIKKQRTYSRLLEMCVPIEIAGKDRRRENLKRDYKEYSDLLGL